MGEDPEQSMLIEVQSQMVAKAEENTTKAAPGQLKITTAYKKAVRTVIKARSNRELRDSSRRSSQKKKL